MKKLFILLLSFTASFAVAQEEKGMRFEHSTTWAEIKAKAKAQNKYIFVDAFTTWCGPCKYMAANIFPLENVGDFFNANYINVKVQLDTTKADNDEVQRWYKDAADIKTAYNVNVFPTYLFLSPSGEMVHRAVGSSDAATFIAKGQDALDPDKQYYTLKKQYDAGKKDPAFLLKLANASLAAYDRQFSPVVIKEYLATQKDLLAPDNIKLLAEATTKSTDPGFDIFRNNEAAADAVLGKGKSRAIVKQVVLTEKVYPALRTAGAGAEPDWATLKNDIDASYPGLADEVLLPMQARYYQSRKDWPKFSNTVSEYVSKFSDGISAMDLNNFAWTIFENCEDAACVEAALAWSKQSLTGADEKNPMFMDTYANLLYKTGKKAEAIKLQEEAVTLAKDDPSMKETLEKMKRGEQTW